MSVALSVRGATVVATRAQNPRGVADLDELGENALFAVDVDHEVAELKVDATECAIGVT